MDGPKLLFIMNEFLDEDAWNAYSCIYYQVADAQMTLLTFFSSMKDFHVCVDNTMSSAILKLPVF